MKNFMHNLIFFHDTALNNKSFECGFKKDIASENERQIIKRIFYFWEAMKHSSKELCIKENDDIWKTIKNNHHSKLISVLENSEIDQAEEFFLNICKTEAIMGFMCHFQYNELINDEQKLRYEAIQTLDILCRLAEAFGVLPLECPEQGYWGRNINCDINKIIVDLEAVLDSEIQSPKAGGGTFGLKTIRGIISRKDCIAIYQAFRLAKILDNAFFESIAEIGGGTGTLAFHLYKRGFRNLKLYDLPQVAALQSYYLIKSLPNAKIRLFGEKNQNEDDSITILPYWDFSNSEKNSYKLVLNSDSFPEIEKEIVTQYLMDIKKNSDLFLSFNQESSAFMWEKEQGTQHIIKDLITEVGGFNRKYRFPFWMRRGYVEELYEVENQHLKDTH